jgi:hypothetical protein
MLESWEAMRREAEKTQKLEGVEDLFPTNSLVKLPQ